MAIVKFEFITNSCEQLRQKMNDWRHKFAETALGALKTYFDDQGLTTTSVRNEAVKILLHNKNFVYKHLDINDEGKVHSLLIHNYDKS
jgi:hypothetical protein